MTAAATPLGPQRTKLSQSESTLKGANRPLDMRHGLLALAVLLIVGTFPLGLSSPAAAQTSPNFVVIVTDDMRAADWEALPQTRALFEEHGTRFENFFVTTSLCCPSRASILTGQYTHNHGVTSSWKQFVNHGLNDDTFAVALNQAGYRTALIGKYLNGFPAKGHVPPGWDRFEGYENNGEYFGLLVNQNGRAQQYGKKRYEADVLNARAQDFLGSLGAGEPFLLYLAPKAPHVPVQ
jgi:N-acetylglucosamine-6-sulfatase